VFICRVYRFYTVVQTIKRTNSYTSKPFLKWAGGKGQITPELQKRIPEHMVISRKITRYIEPFVGGGAFFFHLKHNFDIEDAILIDINNDLILAYKIIQSQSEKLIHKLAIIEDEYLALDETERKKLFYKIRKEYNLEKESICYDNTDDRNILRIAKMIFLNRTCFNGLYRMNKKGEFNVPYGKYKNPKICDKNNIFAVSRALKNVTILQGDYTLARKYVCEGSFIYFDPPYRPITKTSSFTSYTDMSFGEQQQIELSNFFNECTKKGAYVLLSNSDPKNEDPDDDFFEKHYKNHIIERITAKRNINCIGEKRGKINELLISNYHEE